MPSAEEAKIVKGEDGKLRLENFYTPLAEAKKEIQKRWGDKDLRKKIEIFFGKKIPRTFKREPRAVFCRCIFSPNFEFEYFIDLSKMFHLRPLGLQYSHNKFVSKNTPNYHLCRLFFYGDDGKHGGNNIETLNLVDFNKWEGKNLDKIKTNLKNKNLVTFHNKLLNKTFNGKDYEIFDFSDWFNETRNKSKYYYLYYFALFACHGVLFENFLTNKEEIELTKTKVIPSFNRIQKIFGVKPLIFPLNPIKSEELSSWYYYPNKIREIISNENNINFEKHAKKSCKKEK